MCDRYSAEAAALAAPRALPGGYVCPCCGVQKLPEEISGCNAQLGIYNDMKVAKAITFDAKNIFNAKPLPETAQVGTKKFDRFDDLEEFMCKCISQREDTPGSEGTKGVLTWARGAKYGGEMWFGDGASNLDVTLSRNGMLSYDTMPKRLLKKSLRVYVENVYPNCVGFVFRVHRPPPATPVFPNDELGCVVHVYGAVWVSGKGFRQLELDELTTLHYGIEDISLESRAALMGCEDQGEGNNELGADLVTTTLLQLQNEFPSEIRATKCAFSVSTVTRVPEISIAHIASVTRFMDSAGKWTPGIEDVMHYLAHADIMSITARSRCADGKDRVTSFVVRPDKMIKRMSKEDVKESLVPPDSSAEPEEYNEEYW